MFRNGFKSIREIVDYWEYLISNNNSLEAEKSMRSLLKIWKEKHSGYNYAVSPKVGDFYWIEYGNNIDPEMSYEHMGLIIKVNNRLLYTIPITTPKHSNTFHRNAYHAIDNPTGNSFFIKLKVSDFPFLAHDSLAKVSEIKPVSIKRLGRKLYHLDISNPLINEIIQFAHRNVFDDFDFKINKLNKENSLLKLKIELNSIPNIINNKAELSLSSSYAVSITKISETNIKIQLTDQYDQTVSKIITINNDQLESNE